MATKKGKHATFQADGYTLPSEITTEASTTHNAAAFPPVESAETPSDANKAAFPPEMPVIPQEVVAPNEVPTDTAPVIKPAKPVRNRKTNDAAAEDKYVNKGIRVDPVVYKKIQFLCLENNVALSKFVRDMMYTHLHFTYHCSNPACRNKFTMRLLDGDDPSAPRSCPVCGGKITKAKF